jgi:hypothetical protein
VQKKYQESLPPKKKARILEDNAVAHKQYQESLPLVKKALILEDKVKAQKKSGSSSLPKKSLEDDAAAHK